MEIEAKFSLPDAETFQRLQSADRLAGFTLSAAQVKRVRDTYLDTAGRLILAAGYACRRREQSEGTLMTLKGLRGAEGAVHRREELEVLLAADRPPAEWPDSPLRDRLLQLIGEAPLAPLFELQQARIVRLVSQDERPVAELSLDEVYLAADGEQTYFELEVELTAQGTEDDLTAIAACLRDEWGLEPEPRSKFERALAFLQEQSGLLTPHERAVCQDIGRRDDMYSRRALALLALDEGASQIQAGERAGLSARRVRHWLAEFRKRRLDIFPDRVLDEAGPELPPQQEPPEATQQALVEVLERPAEREVLTKPERPPREPGLEADDTMAEAARKTFYLHYRRMLYHEPGTRLGEDIEELHDMRVATRRMRAAFRVFGDYLDMEQMGPFLKGLRRTGRALGAVRDLDVFWEKTRRYLDTLPPEQPAGLEPLRAVWEAQREVARERMLAYLDGDHYARFKEEFGGFLQTPGAGARKELWRKGEPIPHRLRHVVPLAVYQRLAAVRAYDEWVSGPDVPIERLHRLRITAKGLRYTLEYFREVLGPEAKTLIDQVKGLQDHLGDLQDATVASNLLRDFLTWGTWGHSQAEGEKLSWPEEPIVAPGVAAYLTARQTELQRLVETFPRVWEQFQRSEFSQLVASIVAPL